MFLSFFYLLKARGLKPSLREWMELMRALDTGLARDSLTAFYYLCRSIIVSSEADFDKFDMAFAEYFKGVSASPDLPDEFVKWLEGEDMLNEEAKAALKDSLYRELDELMQIWEDRKKTQKERHDGGSHWIGTGGTSPTGHGGYAASGIRAGGEGRLGRALQIAGERNFKDFRQDDILDIRQFQMAFRKLRQFSSRLDEAKTELDIDETVEKTSERAGLLEIAYMKPRRNTVKLLIMFDSGGSMMPYSRLLSRLFTAVSKSNHFKDVQFYYFHNCIYEHLYTDPQCRRGRWVETDYVLKNMKEDYRVIMVGDASMAPSELTRPGGNVYIGLYNETPGMEWLYRFRKRYEKAIWLNPVQAKYWDRSYGTTTIKMVREIFPMFELTIDGLDAGIKKLLSR